MWGNREPLEEWLFSREMHADRGELGDEERAALAAWKSRFDAQFARLLAAVANPPPPKKLNWANYSMVDLHGAHRLAPDQIPQAQTALRRVYEISGSGTTYMQERLLNV